MNTTITSTHVNLQPEDNSRLANLCGQHNQHIQQFEEYFGVEINNRGFAFDIIGPVNTASNARQALTDLYKETTNNDTLTPKKVHLFLGRVKTDDDSNDYQAATIHIKKMTLRARGRNQSDLINNVETNHVNFAVGPAGTGKTYLAVAKAVEALEREQVQRLILTRPAVEAGERLGFLPGDLAQKVDPYLRPLYDALYEMLGFEHVAKLIETNVIEIAPLAYMRGRNLNDAYILLDEAQNTTEEQMKMFLTRIGFGSTAIITGDITQIDLPRGQRSGLRHVIQVLEGVEGVSFTFFNSGDIVRHPIVQAIVDAYDRVHKGRGDDHD